MVVNIAERAPRWRRTCRPGRGADIAYVVAVGISDTGTPPLVAQRDRDARVLLLTGDDVQWSIRLLRQARRQHR
jgi:hypothetical protein